MQNYSRSHQRSVRTPARLLLVAGVALAAAFSSGCNSGGSAGKPRANDSQMAAGMLHVEMAEDSVRSGDLEAALKEFEQAIEVNPNLTQAHMGMGDIYRMQGDYSSAEKRYAKAAEVEPRNFDAQFYHGLMLHMLDRVRESIQAYLKALAIRPNDFRANLNLATAYYQMDENQRALEFGKKAVELNPKDGAARFNLGAVYAALDMHREAVTEYQQAAEQLPLTPELLMNLADSLGKLNRFSEMRSTLEQVVRSEPTAEAYERLGFAQFKMRDYDAAELNFGKSLDMDPNYFPALNGDGVCLLNRYLNSARSDTVSRDKGISMLRRSVQIDPNQPRIVELLSRYGQ